MGKEIETELNSVSISVATYSSRMKLNRRWPTQTPCGFHKGKHLFHIPIGKFRRERGMILLAWVSEVVSQLRIQEVAAILCWQCCGQLHLLTRGINDGPTINASSVASVVITVGSSIGSAVVVASTPPSLPLRLLLPPRPPTIVYTFVVIATATVLSFVSTGIKRSHHPPSSS